MASVALAAALSLTVGACGRNESAATLAPSCTDLSELGPVDCTQILQPTRDQLRPPPTDAPTSTQVRAPNRFDPPVRDVPASVPRHGDNAPTSAATTPEPPTSSAPATTPEPDGSSASTTTPAPVSQPLQQPDSTTPPAVDLASAAPNDPPATIRIAIPSLAIDLPILDLVANSHAEAQGAIDSCRGAVAYDAGGTAPLLAAHRTSCGAGGFAGIDTLDPTMVVELWHGDTVETFAMYNLVIGYVGEAIPAETNSADLILQTSRSSHSAYFVLLRRLAPA